MFWTIWEAASLGTFSWTNRNFGPTLQEERLLWGWQVCSEIREAWIDFSYFFLKREHIFTGMQEKQSNSLHFFEVVSHPGPDSRSLLVFWLARLVRFVRERVKSVRVPPYGWIRDLIFPEGRLVFGIFLLYFPAASVERHGLCVVCRRVSYSCGSSHEERFWKV